MTLRMSGSAPARTRSTSRAQAGTSRRGAARRGPRDVGHRHPVARVEEARRATLRQRLAGHPGAHARHRVAAVLEDLGDVPDLVGAGQRRRRRLGRLVGVEGALVVGVGARVERLTGEVDVEVLELDAEGGDVLLGEPLHGGDLGLDAGRARASCRTSRRPRRPPSARRGRPARGRVPWPQRIAARQAAQGCARSGTARRLEQVVRRPPTMYDLLREAAGGLRDPPLVRSRRPRRTRRLARTGAAGIRSPTYLTPRER